MADYIIIKKKTLSRCLAALCVAALAVALWIALPYLHLPYRPPVVETHSYLVLKADGKVALYFRSVRHDSVFVAPSASCDRVNHAAFFHPAGKDLHAFVEVNRRHIAATIRGLEQALGELSYYLSVHDVQDEGFDMVAEHAARLKMEIDTKQQLLAALDNITDESHLRIERVALTARVDSLRPSGIFLQMGGGTWNGVQWTPGPRNGKGVATDYAGRTVAGLWNADTIVAGARLDTLGIYIGDMNRFFSAEGHGTYVALRGGDGSYGSGSQYYEGHFANDKPNGYGYAVDTLKISAGEWKNGKCRGERLHYTSERIYGIDVSKYQHGHGKRYYPIQWNKLRITHLGNKAGNVSADYPVSFAYIKSTEGTNIRNRYYAADSKQARNNGIRVGAYHFFSIRSSGTLQARHFINNTTFKPGDLPPVLDVEPTDKQIRQMGGIDKLFTNIRQWLSIVENHTGVAPILYVNQRFVNKYLDEAPDIKSKYKVWIARYGEFKPDLKLVIWQLAPDGKVDGIRGNVDINVFNGYRGRYDAFLEECCIKE